MANTDDIKMWLNRYRRKVMECDSIRQEVEYAEDRYGSVKGVNFDGLPSGKGSRSGSLTERAVLRKIKLEEILREREAELEADWQTIEAILDVLSPTENLLIRLRYYYAADWDSVCKRLYGKKSDYTEDQESYKSRVFHIHGRALSALAKKVQKK